MPVRTAARRRERRTLPLLLLSLLLACADPPPPSTPSDWHTPADCRALPISGKRQVCWSVVLPALICADPDAGMALLESEVTEAKIRDHILLRITRDHFPYTDVYCRQIVDAERQELCRAVQVRALTHPPAPSACAPVPVVAMPQAAWCSCSGPPGTLRILQPTILPEEAGDAVMAALRPKLGQLAQCHRTHILPHCPCHTAEAVVHLRIVAGAVQEAAVEGELPEAEAGCVVERVSGWALPAALTATADIPIRQGPRAEAPHAPAGTGVER